LAGFIRQAWAVLEPETELDWKLAQIDAIAAHLEAVRATDALKGC